MLPRRQDTLYADAAKHYNDMCYAVIDDVEHTEVGNGHSAAVVKPKHRWTGILRF